LCGKRALVNGADCGRWELHGTRLLVERPVATTERVVAVDLLFHANGRKGVVGATGNRHGRHEVTIAALPSPLVSEG
jgi:hypothetical protein